METLRIFSDTGEIPGFKNTGIIVNYPALHNPG
jgi:hypothetical protein